MTADGHISPLVSIVGITASGKSALAMDLAQQFNGEIICADSWTVYRGFDIGTAKPTAEDAMKIPHHLIDVADPTEGFSAAVFQRLAQRAIEDISSRGKLPILVGGTGLYIDSVLFDYSFLPPSDPGLRTSLNAMSLKEVLERAVELGLDTTGIDLRNKRRVIRIIENNGIRPTRKELRDDSLVLGIAVDREEARERIAKRIDEMLRLGLEEEVRQLAECYGWDVEPMKGIGYREWRDYFIGMQTLEDTRGRILKASMDLAKRQQTWFRRNQSIQWLTDRSKVVDIVTTFLNNSC